jgi:thioredoxin reductase (NADPH)
MQQSSGADLPDHEAVIIGAGPAGLWAAFQLGIHGVRSVLIDSQSKTGGQCAALYADKPVFDLPGFSAIDAGDIVHNLENQLVRFQPVFRLGETVTAIRATLSGFAITLSGGEALTARYVILATGLGPFGLADKQPSIELPPRADYEDGHLMVTTDCFETGCENLFAVGDAVIYPGKLSLLASAFHESALMAFAIRKRRAGGRRAVLEYSSTSSTLKALFTDR